MGYAENMITKTIAKLGHDVHLVTANVQVYFNSPEYQRTYEKLLGPAILQPGVKNVDGYTLHRLPHTIQENKLSITGLQKYLEQLKPDVIQVFEIDEPPTYDAAQVCKRTNIALFTESHMHKSVFLQTWRKKVRSAITRILPAQKRLALINDTTILCYPIAEDVADLAIHYFKVPASKIKIQSLGVDTELFRLPEQDEIIHRKNIRQQFGFEENDIVCIYTGRFSKDKDPHTLARAIDKLAGGNVSFKGLFVGNGTPEDIQFISSMKNCIIQPFVKVEELNKYYWAADIGVWPRQESTSQLDAAACGLPLVLSNKIHVTERVNGNGFLYEEGDSDDLAGKLLQLADHNKRKELGSAGNKKVINFFSWRAIASERLSDYRTALTKRL